jgi:hypothetical protein
VWPEQGELPVLQSLARTGLLEREGDLPPVQVLYSLGRMTVLLEPEEDSQSALHPPGRMTVLLEQEADSLSALHWLERTLLGPGSQTVTQHQQEESPHSQERLHLLLE